jgi:hypothetical protein
MNIKKYASVPKLVEIILDNEELLERYEEPITFYSYDVVPMTTYFEFFNARSNNEFVQLDKMMKNMILDKNGKRVLADNEDLPIDIAAAAINKLGEILGKSLSKTSTQKVGEPAK